MRDWIMLALAILLLGLAATICAGERGGINADDWTAEDFCRVSESEQLSQTHVLVSCADAVKDLGEEIARLNKEYHLPWPVSIICLRGDMSGWAVPPQGGKVAFIYIVPRGKSERIKVLRHEWQHLLQVAEKRTHIGEQAEAEARAAEKDGVLTTKKGKK